MMLLLIYQTKNSRISKYHQGFVLKLLHYSFIFLFMKKYGFLFPSLNNPLVLNLHYVLDLQISSIELFSLHNNIYV
jgi:hypothetical protein